MHPNLGVDFRQAKCANLIGLFQQCHKDNTGLKKYTNACNEAKIAMETCLKGEKLDRQRANMENAREKALKRKAKLDAYYAETGGKQ